MMHFLIDHEIRKRRCINVMKCKVSVIKGNLRYRILTINNENYILDMGQSIWRFLLPAFFWFFPLTVYKVNDENILEKLETSSNPEEKSKQKNVGELSVLGGAICIPLGSLVYSLLDTSLISSSIYINIVVVTLPYLFIVFFFVYMGIKFKNKLKRIIHLRDYPKEKLRIRPQSLKPMFSTSFYFLLFLLPSVFLFISYIQKPNVFLLIAGTFMFLFAGLNSIISISAGDYVAKFENGGKEQKNM